MRKYLLKFTITAALCFLALVGLGGCGGDDPATDDEAATDTVTTGDDDVANPDESGSNCGNQIVEAGEQCDGVLKKCVDVDAALYTGGNALCFADCTWDVSGCVLKEEPVDYDYAMTTDNEQPDNDPGDVTSGFPNNPDCQCSVDRNDVCTKADYDAWSGAPVSAPENANVKRLCIGGVWLWAPFSMVGTAGECTEALCLAGEARQFLQAGTNGFCVCLNKCTLQTDDADKKPCGTGRSCVKTTDAAGADVFVCGGHQ